MSRTPPWHPHRPHNALPVLPPPVDLETKPVLKRVRDGPSGAGRPQPRCLSDPESENAGGQPAAAGGAGELGDREHRHQRGHDVPAPSGTSHGRPRNSGSTPLPHGPARGIRRPADQAAGDRDRRTFVQPDQGNADALAERPGNRDRRSDRHRLYTARRTDANQRTARQLGGLPARHRRDRSAGPHGRRPLPVRGDPSVHRRQRPHGTRAARRHPRQRLGALASSGNRRPSRPAPGTREALLPPEAATTPYRGAERVRRVS